MEKISAVLARDGDDEDLKNLAIIMGQLYSIAAGRRCVHGLSVSAREIAITLTFAPEGAGIVNMDQPPGLVNLNLSGQAS